MSIQEEKRSHTKDILKIRPAFCKDLYEILFKTHRKNTWWSCTLTIFAIGHFCSGRTKAACDVNVGLNLGWNKHHVALKKSAVRRAFSSSKFCFQNFWFDVIINLLNFIFFWQPWNLNWMKFLNDWILDLNEWLPTWCLVYRCLSSDIGMPTLKLGWCEISTLDSLKSNSQTSLKCPVVGWGHITVSLREGEKSAAKNRSRVIVIGAYPDIPHMNGCNPITLDLCAGN